MNYSESVLSLETLRECDVRKLLSHHGLLHQMRPIDWEVLDADCPPNERGERNARDVMNWLGY